MRVFITVAYLVVLACFCFATDLPSWQKLLVAAVMGVCYVGLYTFFSLARAEDLEDQERYAALKRQPPADNPSPVPATSEKGGAA